MGRQTKHDERVRRTAGGYVGRGYYVEADIPGYPKPPLLKIDGESVRPDVIVHKGERTREIIEIETPESVERDKDQRRLLKKYADKHPYTSFRWSRTR